MTEDEKSTQQTKSAPKMVPESQLMAVKNKASEELRRLKEELADKVAELANAKSELEVSHTDVEDDEEVQKVKAYLLSREKDINSKEAKLQKDLASYEEREKESRVQSLASLHQVELDAIKDAEDPEKEALRLVNERLSGELEKKASESVFETGSVGIVKKKVADMDDKEFEEFEQRLKKESLSKSEIVMSR